MGLFVQWLFDSGSRHSTIRLPVALVALIFFITVATALATVPGKPIVGPASVGSKQVTINFTAPAFDGGSPITSYTVTSQPDGVTATGDASPITVGGLTNGTAYLFSVTATNVDGSGPSSPTPYYSHPRLYAPTSGTINNLVVFIRFSDQPEFTKSISFYDGLFNSARNSLKNFYLENSYGALTVDSTFYPKPAGGTLVSYQDSHPTSYYQGVGPADRETVLVTNALNAIKDQIPENLLLDGDGDGYIDHITFEVYSSDVNPLPGMFYSRATFDTSGGISLRGSKVGSYTWVSASQDQDLPVYSFAATEIHEMGHSFGYPDLRGPSGHAPVGDWDVMSMSKAVHSNAYLKYRFTGWIPDIPEITTNGNYVLNDSSQSTNNSYKIKLPNSHEFLVLEYRKAAGPFESNLPGSGLCITRVNEAAGTGGNQNGPPYFLYTFRPDGTFLNDGNANNFSCLNAESGRVQFNDSSNPACFLSDGSPCGISIDAIGSASGSSITFSVIDPANTVVKRLISGYLVLANGSRVGGATVMLSGGASAQTTTDSLGRYLFVVNDGGSYTVTPVKTYVTFTPANISLDGVTTDKTPIFAAAKVTNSVSGQITSSGAPLSGIPVSIYCPAGGNYVGQTLTDANGSYSFVVDAGSTCDLSPGKINYFFTPNKRSFKNIAADQILQNFSTWTAIVTLSGTITANGIPLSGVGVSCLGTRSLIQVATDAVGKYSCGVTVGDGSTYTVTPSVGTHTFTPSNRFYTGLVSTMTKEDFSGVLNPALTVTFLGDGGGMVTGTGGYGCGATPCPPQYYATGTNITLTAWPDTNSMFSGWTLGCGNVQDCDLTMDVPRDITATFDRLRFVRIVGDIPVYCGLLGNAYKDALGGDQIQSQAQVFDEDLLLDAPLAVTFAGGYDDTGFTNNNGYTTIHGSLTIRNGTVTMRQFRIR
jgi:M6 family metalloprotease-like protein